STERSPLAATLTSRPTRGIGAPVPRVGSAWCYARLPRPALGGGMTRMTDVPIVVVVDDDASVRRALSRLLRSAGCAVETFGTASEFLARPEAPVPSCLVLDVRLPGMSGLDLQARLATDHRELPIVFITGHGSSKLRQRALNAGAVAVLDKPFDDQNLLDA